MANPTWTALEVQVPGKDILKKIRNLLETLILYLDVARTFLNIIKTFLKAIGNPIRALVEAIIALIVSLIEALRRSGFYAWYNFPNLREDPGLKRHAGGYPAFVSRWKGSLLDAQDINRPRPIPGFNKGGFLMIVADVQGPAKLIRLVKVLIKFFSSSFVTPQYPPPANVKVLPFGEKGSPILSVAEVFNSDLKGLAIEWSLGSSTGTADPSFSGLVNEFSREFIPPKWLIEKTSVYPSDQTSNLQGVGSLYVLRADPTARNPRTPQDPVIRKYPVRDEYGQPVVLFEEAEVISASQTTAVYLLTALGTFRYLDQKVTKDKPYWYRIRAFSGSLDWNPQTKKINFNENNVKADPNRRGYYYLEWPSTDANDLVVMGQPSGIISGKIVTLPKFDVIENLRHLFLAAFSLNFQQPIPLVQAEVYDPAQKKNVPQVDASGYPVYLPVFDANGDPLPQYKDQVAIGYGSLSSQAGALASYKSIPILGVLLGSLSAQTLKDLSADAPWTQANVRLQAARLTNTYASLLLEAGGSVIENFRALMQGPLPSGPPSDSRLTTEGWSTIKSANTIEKLVFGLTETKPQLTFPDVDVAKAIQNEFTWEVMGVGQLRTYNLAWSDNNVRRNVLAAVNFIKTLGYQGQPPDWVRVSLLQDIVPWSGQILFDMLAKIQALLDAYQGLLDDIVKFIDLIIRKIDVLERFIRFIIEILNFIEQLSAGFYFLSATGLTNGISDWFNAIDTSVGDKPKSTADGGYTAGLCLAYLAPDVTPIETALDLIF